MNVETTVVGLCIHGDNEKKNQQFLCPFTHNEALQEEINRGIRLGPSHIQDCDYYCPVDISCFCHNCLIHLGGWQGEGTGAGAGAINTFYTQYRKDKKNMVHQNLLLLKYQTRSSN